MLVQSGQGGHIDQQKGAAPHAEAGQHAAQDVQRPRRDAPDQQKTEVRRPVLGQIADVFKGGEGEGDC